MRWVSIYSLFILAFVSTAAAQTHVDSLYQVAVERIGQVSIKESINEFQQVLKVDQKYAPAYHEMAKLYMALDTVNDRQRAKRAIVQARWLDPQNVAYELTFGNLQRKQAFFYNSEQKYKQILKDYAGTPEAGYAAYIIGQSALEEFMTYKDLQMIGNEEFADQDLKLAIYYLQQSIAINPTFLDAYYKLGLTYLESEQPRKMIQLMRALLPKYPENNQIFSFCGLGYLDVGDNEQAYAFFETALQLMTSEERSMMMSVDVLLSDDAAGRLHDPQHPSDDTLFVTNKLVNEKFWKGQDPLFLSDFNERKTEHYRRVTYANLRFGFPSKNIAGWQTDRGRAYIKFGPYLHRTTLKARAKLETSSGTGGAFDHLIFDYNFDAIGAVADYGANAREFWFYDGFAIMFAKSNKGNWSFGSFTSAESHKSMFAGSSGEEALRSGKDVFEQEAAHYVDPYTNQKYSLPHQVAVFQSGEKKRIEIAYAIPKNLILDQEGIQLDQGVFLFNQNWSEIYKQVVFTSQMDHRLSGYQREYFLAQNELRARPGQYHLIVEVGDKLGGMIGTFRDSMIVTSKDALLAMSDLLLATQIEALNPFPEVRQDLNITQNPLRTYKRTNPLFLYFEIYNLSQNQFSRTQYEVAYEIGRPEQDKIDASLFLPILYKHLKGKVYINEPSLSQNAERKITAEYAGDREDDIIYLQADLNEVPVGIHRLEITVKDLQSGQFKNKDALFRVIE